jgi:hypothetical protein
VDAYHTGTSRKRPGRRSAPKFSTRWFSAVPLSAVQSSLRKSLVTLISKHRKRYLDNSGAPRGRLLGGLCTVSSLLQRLAKHAKAGNASDTILRTRGRSLHFDSDRISAGWTLALRGAGIAVSPSCWCNRFGLCVVRLRWLGDHGLRGEQYQCCR